MKIRTLIVDDEPHAIEVIDTFLQQFTDLEVLGRCNSAIQAFQLLQQKQVDLMFLDIKMPGLNGNDLLRSLKNPPKVIFTTAYSEYALEGFELNAVDYLLKPIAFDRFLRAMDKVYQSFDQKHASAVLSHEAPIGDSETFLYLKVERKTIKLNINDILWIESLRDYVKVVTADQVHISKQKISFLEEMLPERRFVRIHRSFIVSLPKIDSFYGAVVEVSGHELPIGRNYKQDLQKKLKTENLHFS
ncbi:LytTR family DNA-binding domain-containing protein [Mucilaginibacter daejeonensis]|uniref:LytR/AlgR family response regulator transcription factor n=1 Tax=Mucilaginibacter daejeonensis TaxID=398049 RepID=UPI001D179194|nr:LytTR family DNA-binding domain-containing protein [Mucilaginibacter daejeonensis]UEG54427.1 LytTR family DNA-binding domain-containing protein [Mucilaginibacter daejeonensis]